MLVSITVKQFGLIEQAHLELSSGMTVFSGETGAGKSMLVDALGAAFGARSSSDWVRHEAEKAEVTAVWQGHDARLDLLLEASDIDADDDELILRRVITCDGRSRAYLNGVPVTLKTLREIGNVCLDLHGQHEHQSLMQVAVQKQLLDVRVAVSLMHDVAVAFDVWHQLKSRLLSMHSERGEAEQQAGWMREELGRLGVLDIETGLAEALQLEVDAGRHHVQIQQAASEAIMLLDEGDNCVRDQIARAGHAVAAVEDFHEGLRNSRELIDQIDTLLGELAPELRHVTDQSFDEQSLRQSENRLMQLHESMRRHDRDEAGLLLLMDEWRDRLAALDTASWDEATLLQALDDAGQSYQQCAMTLNHARKTCGEVLIKQLRPLLDRLALAGMQVRFDVIRSEDEKGWHRTGFDQIVMKVMSNPGEPWRDLAAVASGGELSRLVLALKGCGVLQDMPQIAVFDEVDTGIGGETAWSVGELLAAMGNERQVLVISHLPQVASCAEHQVVISKATSDGRTVTGLESVSGDSRLHEIARMLGGGEHSLGHAAEMLKRARLEHET